MKKIVLVADILTTRVVCEKRHFEVSEEVAKGLLAKLNKKADELKVDVEELKDLIKNRGEISNVVKLSGKSEKVGQLLRALTISAWEHEVPFTVDEVEDRGFEEERFDEFCWAYLTLENGDWDVEIIPDEFSFTWYEK